MRLEKVVALGLVMGFSLAMLDRVASQERYRAGQQVEVQVQGRWVEGTVLRMMPDGQSVQVRIGEGGRAQLGVVRLNQVRKPGSEGAEPAAAPTAEMRVWTDTSGQFQVEAALVVKEGDNVKLRKKDGAEIAVPLAKLSRADVEYLAKTPAPPASGGARAFQVNDRVEVLSTGQWYKATVLKVDGQRYFIHYDDYGDSWDEWVGPDRIRAPGAAAPAVAAGDTGARATATPVTAATVACDLKTGSPEVIQKMAPPQGLAPDPAPYPAPPEGAVTVRDLEIFETLAGGVGADPSAGTVLLSIVNQPPGKSPTSQFVLCDLKAGKTAREASFNGNHLPVAGSMATGWLLTTGLREQIQAVAWNWKPGELPSPGYALTLATDAPNPFAKNIETIAVVGTDRAVIESGAGQVALWNLAQKKLERRWEASEPAVSPGGRYLALYGADGVAVFDLAASKQLGYWPLGYAAVSGMAFSPQGTKLACLIGDDLKIFDLRTGEAPQEIGLPQGAGLSQYGRPLWTSESHLLIGRQYLVDVEVGFVLWRYQPQNVRGTPWMESFGGRLCYVASDRFGRGESTLRCLRLPHDGALQAGKAVDHRQLFGLAPGTEVSLQSNLPAGDAEKVRAVLEKKATANGWKVVNNAPVRLVALITRGEEQSGTFRDAVGFGGQETTVRIRPFVSTLDMVIDNQKAWSRSASGGLPGILIAKEGQTLQQAASQYEKPDVDFFSRVNLPPKLVRPRFKDGLGESQLAASGIVTP